MARRRLDRAQETGITPSPQKKPAPTRCKYTVLVQLHKPAPSAGTVETLLIITKVSFIKMRKENA